MEYPEYKLEIKAISKNSINILGLIHISEGDYMPCIDGFTISKETAKEIILILENINNIVNGELKNIKINNSNDKISFEYEGTEIKPRLYLYNDEHIENDKKIDGGLLRIPLEPELFWGEKFSDVYPKNVKMLIDELKKYI